MSDDRAYLGVKPCGCVGAAMTARVKKLDPRGFLKELRRWALWGWDMKRVPLEEARAAFGTCPHEAEASAHAEKDEETP